MAIRLHFEKQLELLHMDLVKMGSMVEQSIEDGIGALMRRDTQLAQRVVGATNRSTIWNSRSRTPACGC